MAAKEAFVGACVELFSLLWVQLESIATDIPEHSPNENTSERRVQIVRLELIVWLDACHASRWRILLDGEQRHALERCLTKVLECLNSRFEHAPLQAIEGAQNYLLDAVLEHHRVPRRDRTIDQPRQRVSAPCKRLHCLRY